MKSNKKKNDDKKTELEKVEERREEVLAQGRKFKYPLQYTKHRVVVNTIVISVIVAAMLVVFGWFALYKIQMTDEVLYRITRVFPVSVAVVDGERVNFSDYLMLYRSSILSVERQSSNDDGDLSELKNEYKRVALTKAEEYAYAQKIANEMGIEVTDEEIDAEFERHRQVGGVDRSKEAFLKILSDNFGLDESDYRRMLYLTLMKAKVEAQIDDQANELATQIEQALTENGGDLAKIAEELGEAVTYETTGGFVDTKNVDGGRATEAMKLEAGEISDKFISLNGDGYYFVKLNDKNDAEVDFSSIFIPFSEFDTRFGIVEENEKINEFISVE